MRDEDEDEDSKAWNVSSRGPMRLGWSHQMCLLSGTFIRKSKASENLRYDGYDMISFHFINELKLSKRSIPITITITITDQEALAERRRR